MRDWIDERVDAARDEEGRTARLAATNDGAEARERVEDPETETEVVERRAEAVFGARRGSEERERETAGVEDGKRAAEEERAEGSRRAGIVRALLQLGPGQAGPRTTEAQRGRESERTRGVWISVGRREQWSSGYEFCRVYRYRQDEYVE